MFSKKFKPIFTAKNNLIRLGPKRDGGYVIDKRIIRKIDHIITCGLNDDWMFEKNFLKYSNKTNVLAYDHNVNSSFWLKRLFKDIIHFFLLKKLSFWKIINIFGYLDYILFFKNKNKHFKIKVGKKNIPSKEITINEILKDKKKVLLKVDIEGAEYEILKEINKFISQIKDLKIIHIHGNNVHKIDKYGFPYAIELSFINSKLIKLQPKKNFENYPITKLDYPSVKRNEDIEIKFI